MKQGRLGKFLSMLLEIADWTLSTVPILIGAILYIMYKTEPAPQQVPDLSRLLAGILGLLFFIGVNNLWDKLKRLRRIEDLSVETYTLVKNKIIDRVRADEFFHSSGPTKEFFLHAKSICISGITLGQTTRELTDIIGQCIVNGAHVRIILIDYQSDEVLNQIMLRSFGSPDTGHYAKLIGGTSGLIRIIGDVPNASGTLEIGYLPFVPSFGIKLKDPLAENGAAFVEIYHHNSRKSTPDFELTASRDPYWFEFYKDQFELMWNRCRVEKILVDGKSSSSS